jgi:hypothetical protein
VVVSDIVNPTHVACNLFITIFYISIFLQKLRTLSSTTYISVVIDCIFSGKWPVSIALI